MEKYEEITIEVIEFESDDVIVTSGPVTTRPAWIPQDDDYE